MADEPRVGFGPLDPDTAKSLTDEEKDWLRSWNRESEIPGEDEGDGEQPLVNTLDPNDFHRQAAEAAQSQANGEDVEDEYSDMDVDGLKDELRDRGLPVSGNKADLQQRLREDDAG